MSAPTPQNTQQQQQVPAMVLGFNNDVNQSEVNRYPEALPATGVPVSPAVPTTQPKKLDDESAEAPSYPQAPRPPTGPRDFSSGICDLHQSWAIFADAWCCTYCLASGHHNLVVNEQEGMYAPVCCGLFWMDVGISAISTFLPQTICFHTCFMRHLIRQRYHLHSANVDHTAEELEHRDGGVKFNAEFFLDCMTVAFCLSCAVAQHQREILRQGEWCGGVFSDRHALETPSTVHTV